MTEAQQALLLAAKRALTAMCKTTAPNNEFTDAVDELDRAITAVEADPRREKIMQAIEFRGLPNIQDLADRILAALDAKE